MPFDTSEIEKIRNKASLAWLKYWDSGKSYDLIKAQKLEEEAIRLAVAATQSNRVGGAGRELMGIIQLAYQGR